MTLRAAPGPQLSSGRLRVDAARAIAKLREYQLVDRTAWVLEAIRAAIASGATRISLDGDANDVWLRWEGAAWPAEELPRLFDELVSPEPARASQHLRLLAAAVNSALGMRPAYVDVLTIAESGTTTRVRYTPDVLEETGALEDAPLRELDVEVIERPDDAPAPGMVVHLRRRAGLETLGLLFQGPPELAVARRACADVGVPMRIGGEELGRHALGRDVLRVPLGQDLGGWLAVTDPVDGETVGTSLVIAEHGVVLARYPSELVVPSPWAPVPVRLFVDATRMPTNASRSEVRLQGHPIAAAETRARELVPVLIAQLTAALTASPDDERLRRAALAVIAAAVHGADWSWKLSTLAPPLATLAALPLLRDAVGARRPVSGPWRPLGVHVGDEPFPEELARWLGEVLWVPPGDAAERLIAGASIDRRAVRRHARMARRQLRLERRFERNTKREAKLARGSALVTLRIGAPVEGSCVPDDQVANLDGEVGLFAFESWRGELALLLDGRDIEVVSSTSSIAFTAIADSPRLIPDAGYRGVVRDAELDRVERAVRGTVIRAAEVLARKLAGEDVPRGATISEAFDPDAARSVVRRAIELAHGLGFPVGGSESPLVRCVAWRTAAGERIGLTALRGQKAIGITAPGSGLLPPSGRIVIAAETAEAALLAKVLDVPIVDYDRRVAPRSLDRAVDLARGLARNVRVALVIREPGIAAAIGPASAPLVMLHHAGVELAAEPYPHVLYPCVIAIDADAAIPGALWHGVVDDGGVLARDHTPWEQALARAIASALCGAAAPDLITQVAPRLDDDHGGKLLCTALVHHADGGPTLLGVELTERLRAAPLFTVLDGNRPVSADGLAAAFPRVIPWVPPGSLPVAGDDFHPLVATELVARAAGALARKSIEDGLPELARRRDLSFRSLARATHLSRPTQLLALPIDTPAQVEAAGGLVGVGRDELVVEVRIEGRPFQRVTRPNDLPLVAAVEITDDAVDAAYRAVTDAAIDKILADVRAAAAPLLTKIAQTTPAALADDPRILALLNTWLAQRGSDWQALQALRAAAAWPTLQGARVAVSAAVRGERVRMAAWTGEWLPAGDGEPADALDAPVLAVRDQPGDPLRATLAQLEPRVVEDVTDAVRGLQAQRRMARGLMPPPAIPAVNPALRRPLAALGEAGRALGAGEIALSLETHSTLFLHREGTIAARTNLTGVSPPVELAIERPDLASEVQILGSLDAVTEGRLIALVRPAAAALAKEIVKDQPGDRLAPTIRGHLRRAVQAQWLTLEDVADVAVIESTDGRWWRWGVLDDQRARFGDVWSADPDDDRVPLAEGRLAFRMSSAEVESMAVLGIALVDARPELALDAEARKNLARPLAKALDLSFEERGRTLAAAALNGDGLTSVRGIVAPLAPAHADSRRVRPHRGMHPFDPVNDPCPWPTLAVIDDVRLSGDRTWSVPVGDGVWQETARQIREASEHALRSLVPISEQALASRWIGPELHGGVSPYPASPELQIRGALWLIEPTERGVVVVLRSGGTSTLPVEGAPMAGRLYVHSTSRDGSEDALQAMAKRVYRLLLGDAQARMAQSRELVTTHLARGLASGALRAEDVREARFDCFRPHPYDALQLAGLLHGLGTIDVLSPGADGVGIVDEGTGMSRVILEALGARAVRPAPVFPKPQPLPGLPPVYGEPRPETPRHPLDALAQAVERKLVEIGVPHAVRVMSGYTYPMLRVRNGLELAADHPTLWAIHARLTRGGADAALVIEALTAHALSVLNRDLAEVNDVTEAFALARMLG